MWLYLCTCIVLFNGIKCDKLITSHRANNKALDDTLQQTDVLFADVIKNISRVNNVLQDLINNYEQLQNIYKSQENVKSEDSDSEMDEVFKTKKKEAKRSKNEATTEPEPPPDKSRVTQMFWSDHEEDANSGVDTSKEAITEKETIKQTENKIDITIKPKIQIERTYRNTTTLKPVTSSESKSSDESSDTSTAEENIEKNPERLKILKPLAKPKQPQAESSDSSATEDIIEKKHEGLNIMKLAKSKQPEAESSDSSATEEKIEKRPESIRILKLERPKHQPDAEILFIDTHKKPKPVIDEHKKHKMVKPTPQISNNNNYFEIPPNPKTRYNKVQHNVVKGKLAVPNKSPNDDLNYSIKVKKVMYSERFSPAKIWNDIINNLPIHLEAHSEVIKQAFSTFNKNKSKFSLRRKDVKPAPGNFTKSKNNKKENNEEVSSNEVSSKEVQTNILRDAYAETCLKVVVRKCYKACKKASKLACKSVKCKKAVLSAFGSNCKTGCIKEFQGDEKKIKTKPTLVPVLVRRSQTKPTPVSVLVRRSQTKPTPVPVVRRPKAEETNSSDIKDDGSLSSVCLPHMTGQKGNILRDQTPSAKNETDKNFNILRDRFEQACKKISSGKCNNACKNAYLKMCESNKCAKRMKKAFKKTCKAQCNNAYKYKDKDDSDSKSDSKSDSDSDSDEDDDD